MKISFLNIALLLIILYFSISCGHFPKNIINPHITTTENIQLLNGKYTMYEIVRKPLTDSTAISYSKADIGFNHTFYDELDRGLFSKTLKIDSLKSYNFTLQILNSKKIQINYFENGIKIRQHTINYKLKTDGYVYLRNKNFKVNGIPYLIGEFNVKRSRLTLNNKKQLIFQSSQFSSGGIALLMVYPLGKAKYQKIYQRLD